MSLNPVTMREIRERFRRRRAGLFVTLWVAVVIGVGYLIYLAARAWASSSGLFGGTSPLLISASLGRIMFEMVSLLLLTGVILIVPGVASLSIVGERERLTLPLLQVSQLKPRQIVLGKLASSLAYLMLLVVAVAPIMLVPILFGGIDAFDAMRSLAAIGATAILIGSVSVWVSARARSTRGAVAGSYGLAFAFVALTGLALIAQLYLFAPSDREVFGPEGRELYAIWLNPYIALVSAVDEPLSNANEVNYVGSPFDPIDQLLSYRQTGESGQFIGSTVDDFGGFRQGPEFLPGAPGDARIDGNRGPLWVRSLLVAALLTGLALWGAARQVTVPGPVKRGRLRRRPKEPADAVA